MADFLSITTCSAGTESMLLLGLLAFISFILMWFGARYRIPIFGIFGSISLLSTSWYLSPCVGFIAFAVAGLGIVSFIWFVMGVVKGGSLYN